MKTTNHETTDYTDYTDRTDKTEPDPFLIRVISVIRGLTAYLRT